MCTRCSATQSAKSGWAAFSKRSHLGGQLQRPHVRDIGEHVGGVLEPQAILDQTGLTCLRDEILKDLGEAFDADAFAKISAAGVIGHGVRQGKIEEPTEGQVGLGAFHDLAIGQFVVEAQEQDFEHAHRIDGGPSQARTIGFDKAWPKTFEINVGGDLPQIMIFGDDDREDLSIKVAQSRSRVTGQHGKTQVP